MSIQLSQMTESGLAALAALTPGNPKMFATRYRDFVTALGADIAARYATQNTGVPAEKVLGSAAKDQVFTPITPCRIVDTRLQGPPIPSFGTRNFIFYADSTSVSFAAQGGASGQAGTVCPGTVFNVAVNNAGIPSAAMATVTVVNQGGLGNLIGWGGASPVPNVSILSYVAYNTVGAIANTTILPGGGRSGTGPGGAIEDFAINVNAFTAADVVVDVVGYFAPNTATALDCVSTSGNIATVTNATTLTINADACPSGYTATAPLCSYGPSNVQVGFYVVRTGGNGAISCDYANNSGASVDATVRARCCRVPGR